MMIWSKMDCGRIRYYRGTDATGRGVARIHKDGTRWGFVASYRDAKESQHGFATLRAAKDASEAALTAMRSAWFRAMESDGHAELRDMATQAGAEYGAMMARDTSAGTRAREDMAQGLANGEAARRALRCAVSVPCFAWAQAWNESFNRGARMGFRRANDAALVAPHAFINPINLITKG